MRAIVWTPRRNTEREAVRKHGFRWWLVRVEGNRLLICSTQDIRAGDLRWIDKGQVII